MQALFRLKYLALCCFGKWTKFAHEVSDELNVFLSECLLSNQFLQGSLRYQEKANLLILALFLIIFVLGNLGIRAQQSAWGEVKFWGL